MSELTFFLFIVIIGHLLSCVTSVPTLLGVGSISASKANNNNNNNNNSNDSVELLKKISELEAKLNSVIQTITSKKDIVKLIDEKDNSINKNMIDLKLKFDTHISHIVNDVLVNADNITILHNQTQQMNERITTQVAVNDVLYQSNQQFIEYIKQECNEKIHKLESKIERQCN